MGSSGVIKMDKWEKRKQGLESRKPKKKTPKAKKEVVKKEETTE
jgi:hypothetical protein